MPAFRRSPIRRLKIISGGQTGGDRGGLDAAIELGIEHGGHCPAGRRAQDGIIPPQYNMIETKEWNYQARTKLNVQNSDVTLIFGISSPGCWLTTKFCRELNKPWYWKDMNKENILKFLNTHKPKIINIAGNREQSNPGLQLKVKELLVEVLKEYNNA